MARPDLSTGVWWIPKAREGRDPHEILQAWFNHVSDDQSGRYAAYKEYRRLFANGSVEWGDDMLGSLLAGHLTQNELASTLETLWAQVFKNKIVPSVAVSEASYDEWYRAKGYSRWLEGTFDRAGVFSAVFPRAGLDMLVYGTGCIKVTEEDDWDDEGVTHVACERVSPRQLFVDRIEAKHGKPRTLIQRDWIDRHVLISEYEEQFAGAYGKAAERVDGLMKCRNDVDHDEDMYTHQSCDMLTVYEAWHLPSRPGKKDGRHVIWVKGCTLVDEPWEWPCFPFVFMRFGCPDEGFWGDSAVRRLAPTQLLLDKLCNKIDTAQDVMGVPRIIVRRGANIAKAHIDDVPGGILEADDIGGIREWNAQAVQSELYQERDSCPSKMRSLLGVSDFESTAQVPQGMRDISGEFLNRLVDQGQARHAMSHRAYEEAVVGLAYMFARKAEDLQERGRKVVCQAPGELQTSMQVIDFKDVWLDRKEMKLIVQPMSQLPQTFAGKVDAIARLKQDAGIPLDPKTALRMLQVPDLDGARDMLVSDEECILRNCHHMVRTGEYIPPLPFDNLDLIVKLTTQFINAYRLRKGADMDKVSLLAQYIDDALELKGGLEEPQPDAGVPGAPPEGGPPPDGMMPPEGMAPPGGMPPEGAPPMDMPMGPEGAMPMDPSMMGPMGGGPPPVM